MYEHATQIFNTERMLYLHTYAHKEQSEYIDLMNAPLDLAAPLNLDTCSSTEVL